MKKMRSLLSAGIIAAVLAAGVLPGMATDTVPANVGQTAAVTNMQAWNLNNMIHPDLKARFEQLSNNDFTNVTRSRGNIVRATANLPVDEAVSVRNVVISGYPQIPDLRVRVYEPKNRTGILPAVLWIHGGGYLMGRPEQNERLLMDMVKEANVVVVAPDYRLTPENPYPAAVDDNYTALTWLADSAKNGLNIDKDRIAVAGQSAGGGLTLAVTLRARDEKGPAIRFAMPLYPMIDNKDDTTSSYQITDARVWNRQANENAWKLLLGDKAGSDDVSPYAAPARAKSVSDLPPMYIMIGSLDMFRDEVIDYSQRLLDAGVPVELHVIPGTFHSFETIIPDAGVSQKARTEYIEALKNALQPVK